MNRSNNIFHRMISLVLVFALVLSVCPVDVHAQEIAKSVPFVINGTNHHIDFRFVGDTLYCPADQWAWAADCSWKHNEAQKMVSFYGNYGDSIAIYVQFNEQEFLNDSTDCWVPFFEVSKQCGVFFSGVKNDVIYGYRAKPLGAFYKDMDRMFSQKNYPISSLIFDLGGWWTAASTVARSYAILSTLSVKGAIDAVSGKMDQQIYDEIFVELLKTDNSLLKAFTDLGKEISRPGKIISIMQKSLDEDGALVVCLKDMGFDESDIQEITWKLAQDVYGEKALNDLADYYDAMKYTNLLEILGTIDAMAVSMDADIHTVLAMQEVFSNSDNNRIHIAANKAVEARLGSKARALGMYTAEYLYDVYKDAMVEKIDNALADGWNIDKLDKLVAEFSVWVFDKALSLSNKSDAIMYAEASSLIQLELADYYYEHCDDGKSDTALMMHSVALLYLRSCLASWKMFAFDNSLSGSIDAAEATLLAEITNLMKYTEDELRQSGTNDECKQEISELIRSMLSNVKPETIKPEATVPTVTVPTVDNSYLYQDAMDAYAQLLQRGVMLVTDNREFVAASHYQLLDMDGDRLPEMVVFAVEDYVSLFHIYAYRDGSAWWLGDSLNTCDISKWYNAGHNLYICDGNRLYASADKATATYTDGVWGYLHYDGNEVWFEDGGYYGLNITEELIDNSVIVGGIRIGSDADPLAKPEEPDEWTEEPWEEPEEEPEEWTEESWEEPETESEEEFDIPYDRPADGVYYYSLVDCPSLDSDAFHIYLRDSWQDYETFLNGVWQTSPMGITFQHNAGYEVYNVESWCGIEDNANGTFVIHTKALDGSGTEYRYVIEEGGYISPYDSNGNLGTGYGPKFCWFTHQRLEADDNCVFADDRLIYSSERIEMSMDEFRDALNQADSFVGSYTEVHVTIQDGKITELTLPYIP